MTVYAVRRILENGEIEWASSRKNGGRTKWTRNWSHATLWTCRNGPIAFLTYIKRQQEKHRNKDNCKIETVELIYSDIKVLP